MSLEQADPGSGPGTTGREQREVLNRAARLRDEAARKKPLKSVKGLWADLGVSLSQEEIEQNQADMWRSFPREDV